MRTNLDALLEDVKAVRPNWIWEFGDCGKIGWKARIWAQPDPEIGLSEGASLDDVVLVGWALGRDMEDAAVNVLSKISIEGVLDPEGLPERDGDGSDGKDMYR